MSDSEQDALLAKVDALMQRHRGSSNPWDEDIPVLTEVVEEALQAFAQQHAPSGSGAVAGPIPQEAVQLLLDEIYQLAVRNLQQQVVAQLRPALEQRINASIKQALEEAFAELPQRISDAVGDAIVDALVRKPVEP